MAPPQRQTPSSSTRGVVVFTEDRRKKRSRRPRYSPTSSAADEADEDREDSLPEATRTGAVAIFVLGLMLGWGFMYTFTIAGVVTDYLDDELGIQFSRETMVIAVCAAFAMVITGAVGYVGVDESIYRRSALCAYFNSTLILCIVMLGLGSFASVLEKEFRPKFTADSARMCNFTMHMTYAVLMGCQYEVPGFVNEDEINRSCDASCREEVAQIERQGGCKLLDVLCHKYEYDMVGIGPCVVEGSEPGDGHDEEGAVKKGAPPPVVIEAIDLAERCCRHECDKVLICRGYWYSKSLRRCVLSTPHADVKHLAWIEEEHHSESGHPLVPTLPPPPVPVAPLLPHAPELPSAPATPGLPSQTLLGIEEAEPSHEAEGAAGGAEEGHSGAREHEAAEAEQERDAEERKEEAEEEEFEEEEREVARSHKALMQQCLEAKWVGFGKEAWVSALKSMEIERLKGLPEYPSIVGSNTSILKGHCFRKGLVPAAAVRVVRTGFWLVVVSFIAAAVLFLSTLCACYLQYQSIPGRIRRYQSCSRTFCQMVCPCIPCSKLTRRIPKKSAQAKYVADEVSSHDSSDSSDSEA